MWWGRIIQSNYRKILRRMSHILCFFFMHCKDYGKLMNKLLIPVHHVLANVKNTLRRKICWNVLLLFETLIVSKLITNLPHYYILYYVLIPCILIVYFWIPFNRSILFVWVTLLPFSSLFPPFRAAILEPYLRTHLFNLIFTLVLGFVHFPKRTIVSLEADLVKQVIYHNPIFWNIQIKGKSLFRRLVWIMSFVKFFFKSHALFFSKNGPYTTFHRFSIWNDIYDRTRLFCTASFTIFTLLKFDMWNRTIHIMTTCTTIMSSFPSESGNFSKCEKFLNFSSSLAILLISVL